MIRGARTHNLKNINLILPRDKLDRGHRLVRLGNLPGVRYPSMRRATPLRGILCLCPPVLSLMEKPDVDHRGAVARPSPSSRSPPPTTRARRLAPSPRFTTTCVCSPGSVARCPDPRHSARGPDHQPDGGSGAGPARRAEDDAAGPVVRNRRGRTQAGEPGGPGLHPRPYRRRVCDLSDPPALELHKKHTIEVVVDRFRCAMTWPCAWPESFETALTLSGGMVLVVPMDGDDGFAPMCFSASFACPECGYSASELEPRIFSFNNPAGPAPPVTVLGCSSISIRQGPSMIRQSCPWPAAPSVVGTSAASTTSRCSRRWPIIMVRPGAPWEDLLLKIRR